MREDEGASWFSRWEDQLPNPEDLMPLSQSLITPDLALAFDIPTPNTSNHPTPSTLPPSSTSPHHDHHHHHHHDSSTGADGGSGDEPARTLKRPRLVWTPQLHKRFVDAVAHLGIKNAVPKTIMQLMGVDGLTRENVASHLQKYRLYLKRMQSGGGGGGGASPSSGGGPGIGHISAADHQLFASSPVPHHFLLGRGGPLPEPPFTHSAAAAASMQQLYNHHHQQFFHQRHIAPFGSPPANGFGGGFMVQRMMSNGGSGIGHSVAALSTYPEDMESEVGRERDRRVLTLFPTGDD